ncbi:hypothetical protein DPEC_G00248920 [Dallia pectoralis]|uniref:Uncharacterized protein n=1 Tax=Dallia pectoralis TaxID=75939 RepID=A0ACC2FSG5_DALPE|nr:hypothetical protein DPEC_G00248920 [Dallia pectoralis]
MAAGVSLLTDSPFCSSPAGDRLLNTVNSMNSVGCGVPTARYTKVGETLRHVIPGHMQCSMACGGRGCKYENPARWRDDEQAIKGLYSSWISDNLLAMARPSTEIIEKYNIIEQFQRYGICTVINLQHPGEHASCGNPLEQDSGFTYRPEIFMEAGIYFYNFGWKDYGVASLTNILDMVKVMSFAIQEGKMAVHCHAGLGRTGVLLACYLVFTSRMSADQAILFVRAKRPNSIQTRGQLLCVREFAQFLVPLRNVFSCAEPRANAVTLSQYLTRQRHLLHGYEARQLKNVPKIVHLVCRVLLEMAANRQVVEEKMVEVPDLTAEVEKTVSQQALHLLGKEMRGKGILVPLSHLAGPHPGTSLTQSGTSLTQSGTSLTQSGTSLTQSGTSLTQSGTSLTQSGTSLTQSGTSLTHHEAPDPPDLSPTMNHLESPLHCDQQKRFLQSWLLNHPDPPPPKDQHSLSHTLHVEHPLSLEPWLQHKPHLSPALGYDQELGRLWSRKNQMPVTVLKSLQPGKRLLSFSDSALYKLDPKQDPVWEQNQDLYWLSSLSPPAKTPAATKQKLTSPKDPTRAWESPRSPHLSPLPPYPSESCRPQNHSPYGGGQRVNNLPNQNTSPLFQRRRHLHEHQRSSSFRIGLTSHEGRNAGCYGTEAALLVLNAEGRRLNRSSELSPKPALTRRRGEELSNNQWGEEMLRKSCPGRGEAVGLEQTVVNREDNMSPGVRDTDGEMEKRNAVEREEIRKGLEEVPGISGHLSLKSRHLLVVRALTVDLKDEVLQGKISAWQRDLNTREGAWERLHLERDPVVLAGLMWSWLEQLKEPIISTRDIQALGQNNYNSQHALSCLEKCQRLTLLCILDCAAHFLVLPDLVEKEFLKRTIEVFTKIPSDSEREQTLYQMLTDILTTILHELREKAEEELESTRYST